MKYSTNFGKWEFWQIFNKRLKYLDARYFKLEIPH